jgi:class 3 adenylate cyclase
MNRAALPAAVWAGHLALPLLGLWLLLAQPRLDVVWEDHTSHLVVVLAAALTSAGLAWTVGERARRHADARLLLVALTFGTAAGFLGLHALATPGVLAHHANAAFELATPVGLVLAGFLGVASAAPPRPTWLVAHGRASWIVLAGVLACWALVAAALPAHVPPAAVAATALAGAVVHTVAALRWSALHRRRRGPVVLSVVTAFALLTETLVAIALGPTWRLSWWEWHALMLVAVAFVAYSGRDGRALFRGLALDEALAAIRRDHRAAVEELIAAVSARADWATVRTRLAERFDLSGAQLDVLERAAEALAADRDQIRRLDALVAVGQRVRVAVGEEAFLADALGLVRAAFPTDDIAIDLTGRSGPGALRLPLTVAGRQAGVLAVRRPGGFGARDHAVLASLAGQLSVALENVRLYRRLDGLFRTYLSPEVASALLADPDQAALGGTTADVSVLMADLAGFTPFAERTPPADVVAMLNRYYGAVVPVVLAHGGTVVQFVGDAVMALFGAPVAHPDHPARAVRAALALQAAAAAVAEPGWPRFRVGVSTGPALVGNIGSESMRTFTAIGDTTNLAARLEAVAPAGGVVVSAATRCRLDVSFPTTPLPPLMVKGKSHPVEAYLLTQS